jgi:hypothetical protein
MREGMGNDGFVMNDVDECAGLHLRADYCAEHEWGIQDMKRSFGINDDEVGIERRRIHNPTGVYFVKFKKKGEKCAFISNYKTYTSGLERRELKGTEVKDYVNERRWFDLTHNEQSEGVAGAWNEKNFICVVKGQDNVDKLQEVYDAFDEGDVAIFLGGGQGPFSNAGLSVSIISQLPAELIDNMRNTDMNSEWLKKAALKTGIEAKIKKAGLGFYALSPEWNDIEDHSEGVKFWLNPTDQQNNNHGWYTVDELKQWIKGTGPIPKTVSVKPKANTKEQKWTDENGNLIV